jgi:tetratricopeptide (TPR) repeat protein/KaiC/GvpD/RAD55 family RecA-like ATPase
MSLDDISEMIKQILEQDDIPTEFCKLVYEKTRGNPFFAEEVVKSLKEEEVIYREENKWKIKEVSRIEFPETVKSVLKTRFARLDEECQNVLTLASFVGNDFTLEAMCALTNVEENKLLELMDKMLKTGLIKEREVRGEGVCSFVDILVRDVVYEEVSLLKRKKLHGVVGGALEKVYAKKIDEHFGELAYHFLESGNKDKALDYFLKAGDKAAKIYANSEAASYFQSALGLLEEKGDELREKGQVLERLGDIKRIVGEHDTCMKCWNEALLLWKQLDEKETVARLHRKMANVLWSSKGDTEKAKVHHEEALKMLEKEPENVELASLFEDMTRLYFRTEDMAKARSWAEKALELAKKLNAYEVIANSYLALATVFGVSGEDKKKAIECNERALRIALDNGYMETALRAYNNLAASLPAEENEKGFELLEKGFELAKRVGAIGWISWIGTGLADTYFYMGNMNKAVLLAEESVVLDRKAGNMTNLSYSMNELGFFHQIFGEWDKSEQYHKEALSFSQKAKDTQQLVNSYVCLGWLYAEKGEYVKAREQIEKAIEVSEKAGAKYYQALIYAWGAIRIYIELEETEKAENLLDSMRKFAIEAKDKLLIANADALRAMLFRAQKRWKESIEFFEKSLEEFETLNARRWNVYFFAKFLLCEYARMYLERDQEGDRQKAHNLLNQALEIFQKMGAKKDMEKTESKMLGLETGRQRVSEPKPTAEVSEGAPSHVATGSADLDNLLLGGIPQNYAVILTSPSHDERDLLIGNFLRTGVKKGEVTFYVTVSPSDVKSLAESFQPCFYFFVCNPQADAIIKSLPNVLKLKGVENLTEISIALTSAIHKLDPSQKGPRRICIDLVSDVLLQHHAVQTRRWLAALIPELKSAGFSTLAVIDPRMHPSEELYAILGLFEGEINIYEKETEKGLQKFLKIKKMSNQKYSDSELLLRKEDLKKP